MMSKGKPAAIRLVDLGVLKDSVDLEDSKGFMINLDKEAELELRLVIFLKNSISFLAVGNREDPVEAKVLIPKAKTS